MGYQVAVTDSFSAAHHLRGYQGKCENLHGHNWKISVTLSAEQVNEIGMAIDFAEVKRILSAILQELDHTFLNQHPYFQKVNPTSENIARYIFDQFSSRLPDKKVKVAGVSVWESENCRAIYSVTAPPL
ncbi:MAG: 6-carboxytetrahydropterin synthase QueD [Candidatus Omnitrophota bacterium]